jgi:L-Lysine epsilon oxidase N-terminal/L-lysine epsilon oxidase C-terminal domain
MTTSHKITHFKIYPSLGIARVGNSEKEYFFGPEAPGPHPRDKGDFRDAEGRVKRQAARFRVYGFDDRGHVVKEITARDAQIAWKVQVANTKAAWFDFDQAFDVPASKGEISGVPGIVSNLRNADVTGADRDKLAITPPAVTISGAGVNAGGGDRAYAFDTGRFFDKEVYLGEVRTDGEGRLVFLGGRGLSASKDGEQAVTFANNPGWHDDVSDGPVDATITYEGETYEATGAWVLVGPPNYAPGIQGIVTGYDLLLDVAIQAGWAPRPARPSFSEHVYPVLRRLTAAQWVNAGFARDFGFGTGNDFESPALAVRLNDPSEAAATLRWSVFALFRAAQYPYPQPATIPPYYGDAITLNTSSTDPREWMAVLQTQYEWLGQWAKGEFVADGPTDHRPWDELDAAAQVRVIDRGVLDEVLGGPFHPGAEFTWPMRNPLMYSGPFRVKRRSGPAADTGAQLVSSTALAAGGPLDGALPGDVSRWMAVPWQTDTSSCLSGYIPYVDDYLPTFWPARVPNDVLTEAKYQSLLNPETPADKKETSFAYDEREKWLRGITYEKGVAFPPQTYNYKVSINKFVHDWWRVGIIVEKPGPGGPLHFPRTMWVETGRSLHDPKLLAGAKPEKTYHISQHPRFRR